MAGLEGTKVGPYEIQAMLGVGGMGQVYRARDPRLEREVAVKVLTDALAKEPGYLERFRREARAVAKLNHPNIVQVYDFGEQGDLTYLVMPLITGGTLREYLAQRRVVPLAEAVSIIEQVAGALQYAHERGLIHRDVKPANILLSAEGRALLSDFGIVRLVQKDDTSATLTRIGSFVGSPEYAAPEMVVGEAIDHRVDVYALGVILFQMLTGQLPFSGSTPVSLMMMQAQQPPPTPRSINPDIPPAVEAVILKALAKKPDERFQSVAEFMATLRAASAAPSVGMGYGQASAPGVGTIGDLPTISTYGVPTTPASGPATISPAGPGSVTPRVWVGPGSGPAAYPASGPAAAYPGSGPAGWAMPGSSPAAAPPLPPTFVTGLSVSPNQAPVAPPPSAPPRRRMVPVLLVLLALVLLAAGGATIALGASLGLFKGSAASTPVTQGSPGATPGATQGTTPTATPKPRPRAGTITEFGGLTGGAGPSAITMGPDGNLWFTEGLSNKIGRMTPAGDVTEFDAGSTNRDFGQGITKGPDGNIWFTEPTDNWIGRITPAGSITRFDVGTGQVGITAGPGGALWFTEGKAHKIVRITPAGDITEFAVPGDLRTPFYITAGPDGNLWFTDPGVNKIGRMTPQGDFASFPIPTPNSSPNGITAGPDGNLWFTEHTINKIGRITPDGRITEYRIPTANSLPVGITVGPDGNLWFPENAGNKIGRITPDGRITEYRILTANSGASGITAGPDGNLWFTENAGNKIGRITSGK